MTRRRHPATEPSHDSEPRPQTAIDWLVWLALCQLVALAWLVVLPFVLLYVAVGFIVEVLFRIRLRRSDDSEGPDPPR